jgi:hypothetical protein
MNGYRKCGIYKQWILHTIKKKEILSYATAWVNLEDILLSEISGSQKDQCGMIPLIRDI